MISLETKEWKLDNIDTVLFDKDGTLIDLHFFWGKMTELRVKKVLEHFKLNNNLYEKFCLYLGYNLNTKRMLSDGITAMYSRPKVIELFIEQISNDNVKTNQKEITELFDEVNNEFYKHSIDYTIPIKEAIDFAKELKDKGIKIGIVTSDSVDSTNITIKQFGWESLFEVAIGREDSTESKESGALTKIALRKLNSTPEKAIIIGDTKMDYLAGVNANLKASILVASGQVPQKELEKISRYCINSLKNISTK